MLWARPAQAWCPDATTIAYDAYVDPSATALLDAAQCLTGDKRYAEAISLLNRIRTNPGAFVEAARARAEELVREAATRALDEAEQAAGRGAYADARRYIDAARSVLGTIQRAEDFVGRVERLVSKLSELTVPSFIVEGAANVSVLGFIGSGSTIAPQQVYNARNALLYDVQPIVLGGGYAKARLLDTAGWEQFGLRLGYETNRTFNSGGSITNTTLSQELGVSGVAADVIEGALAFYGVAVEGEHATFTNGRVRRIDVASNTQVDDAPLQFTRTRVEATFDLTRYFGSAQRSPPKVDKYRSPQLALNAIYYQLELPRIAYLTQQDAGGNTITAAESEPQKISVAFGAAGATGRLAWGSDTVSVGALLTLMVGGGNVVFDMPARIGEPAGPDNRVRLHEPTVAIVSRVGIFGEARIPFGNEFGAYVGGALSGEQYYTEAQVPGSINGTVGFADAFYTARLTLTFRYRYLAGN